ncbi:Inner membrane protein YhjD [Meiothermus luteus]|jgi:membrane protein|uniref:Inner membrane protein YhjD n=1 Tax=Meiothermus luteus TaxID=2026184 RepID=A0A399EZG4_9DEIN|nr:YhjD/YihY/BrkB family envelope integrity protein [Meiothermus luteus]RIH87711.1 Inner membrane protein YhjD [Meiothermus luteus]RMH53704.1 MAG: YihY/virulence factor BrkB family protein [Deinococcota bacterium]
MRAFLGQLYWLYSRAHIPFFAAALAYYALFSLMPLLFLMVGLFGLLLPSNPGLREAVLLRLVDLVVALFPTQPDLAQTLIGFLARGAFPLTFASLLALLWVSGNFFSALAYALGLIFGEPSPRTTPPFPQKQVGWLALLQGRLAGLLAPLLLGLALILLALLGLALGFLARYLPLELAGSGERAFPLLGAWGLFFLTYWLLPRPMPRLMAAFSAALAAALAWEGMRLGLPLLLPRTQYEMLYGPVAGFLLGMVGFYLSMWILLAGAVLARALSERYRDLL